MKTAVVFFNNPLDGVDTEYLAKVTECFINNGFPIETMQVLSVNDDLGFKKALERFKDTVDNLVVVDSDQLTFDYKQIIADTTDTSLIENDNAINFLEAVKTAHSKNYSKSNALMPLEATLIPNVTGPFQGFMLEDNEFTLVVLPKPILEFKVACEKYLVPYLDKKFNKNTKRLTLKYFGAKDKLDKAIEQAKLKAGGRSNINVRALNGDYTVTILAEEDNANELVRNLVLELKEEIYAEFDTSLGERLFDLLRIKNLKIATAESFTGGRVVNSIIANAGASSYVHEGIVCYSNESKSQRLGIKLQDVIKDGPVSSMTAYRMAAGLLKSGKTDIAISTTGFAGPKTEGSNDPVGLAFIGVGMMDGIHTYRLNLSGTREEITETAKNAALFLAIKKLKSIK